MADLKNIGNCAQHVLFAASLAVWVWLLWNGVRRRATLPLVAHEPVSWPALPVCATFLVVYFLPQFVMDLVSVGPQARLIDLPSYYHLGGVNLGMADGHGCGR